MFKRTNVSIKEIYIINYMKHTSAEKIISADFCSTWNYQKVVQTLCQLARMWNSLFYKEQQGTEKKLYYLK